MRCEDMESHQGNSEYNNGNDNNTNDSVDSDSDNHTNDDDDNDNDTIRLCVLPKEGHGYKSLESILHVHYEMSRWIKKHC